MAVSASKIHLVWRKVELTDHPTTEPIARATRTDEPVPYPSKVARLRHKSDLVIQSAALSGVSVFRSVEESGVIFDGVFSVDRNLNEYAADHLAKVASSFDLGFTVST